MMTVKNRLVSLLCRMAWFCALVSVFVFYVASVDGLFWIGRFEAQACLIYIVVLGLEIIFNAINLHYGILGYPSGVYMPFKLPVTLYAIISCVLYFSFPFATMEGEKTTIGLIFGAVFILIAIFDWLLFDEKGTVKPTIAFSYAIYPLFYLIFNAFRPMIFGESPIYKNGYAYPYQFLDPKNGIILTGILTSVLVLIGLGLLAILINNLLSGKYKKRRQD